MMTVFVTVFKAEGLTVSEKKTETMLLRIPDQTSLASLLVIESAGQAYPRKRRPLARIERRIRLVWACLRRFGPELYDMAAAPLSLKVRMLKADVIETLLYGCVTW